MIHLFDDKTERFLPLCDNMAIKINKAIAPFIKEAQEKNWSLRDLETLIQCEVSLLISSEILRKCRDGRIKEKINSQK